MLFAIALLIAADAPASQPDLDAARTEILSWTDEQRMDEIQKLIAADARFRVEAASAAICFATVFRKTSLAAISEERKYSQLGGVQNNLKLYAFQENIRRCDNLTYEAKKQLAADKSKPMDCKRKQVNKIAGCLIALATGHTPDECADPINAVMRDAAIQLFPALRNSRDDE